MSVSAESGHRLVLFDYLIGAQYIDDDTVRPTVLVQSNAKNEKMEFLNRKTDGRNRAAVSVG
jgi:hypothetical protein